MAGNIYQAGDRIVTLAPSAHGQLVTSQRGQVVGVDPDAGSLTVRMDDGRTHSPRARPDRPRPTRPRIRHHRSSKPRGDLRYRPSLRRRRRARARIRRHEQSPRHRPRPRRRRQRPPSRRRPHLGLEPEKRQAWAIDTGTPENPGAASTRDRSRQASPGKLRAVLSRARLKAERAALAAAASDQPDPALRRQVAGLDRHIQLLDQRLEPTKNPLARQPFSTPAEAPAPERSSGPTL